ncbi:MAG: glycosyltransferase [Actinomycetota bacterium]
MSDRRDHGVAAVVSVFNADESLISLCESLVRQCSRVVVVDDASTRDLSDLLDRCSALGCVVVRQQVNSGIAAALNAGVRAAGDFDWLLTLDQDSHVDDDYATRLVDAAVAAATAGIEVGMVAPETIRGLPSRVVRRQDGIVFGGEPIQSGLVIPRSSLDRLGPFLEDLFIDSVDTEYYLRAKVAGLPVVIAPGVSLGHSLGDVFYPTLFGRRLRVGGTDIGLVRSAPFRYYYIARNHIEMLRLYGRSEPGWAIRETLLDARHMLIVLLVMPRRRRHVKMLIAGWRDGFKGVGGRIPPGLD